MIIVNYGGGTNSTALLVEAQRRGLRPDVIVFADTGNEHPHTYAYLETFAAWCASVRYPAIDIVKWIRKDGSFLSIEDACMRHNDLPSKAYGLSGCTSKWKQQPIDKFIKEHPMMREVWDRGETVDRWIGYDADEPSRVERMLAKNPQPAVGERANKRRLSLLQSKGYPFTVDGVLPEMVKWRAQLLDWDMGRDECVETIARAGLTQPGKSSCFFCPSMKKHEIDRLGKEHPDLLQRALRIEDNARENLTSVVGLGRNFSWRAYVERAPEAVAAREVVEPECGCYDGKEG